MAQTPATNRQVPDNAILDHFNKQAYLGNRYTFNLAVTAGGTTEVAEILLSNPAVSTAAFPAQNISLFVDLRRLSGVTASANSVMRVYINPTVSNVGTPQTEINMRTGSASAAVGVVTSAPTVSSNGTLIEVLCGPEFSSDVSSSLIILDAGKQLLVTIQTASAAVVNAQIAWSEI